MARGHLRHSTPNFRSSFQMEVTAKGIQGQGNACLSETERQSSARVGEKNSQMT